jgi:hypothetical protein
MAGSGAWVRRSDANVVVHYEGCRYGRAVTAFGTEGVFAVVTSGDRLGIGLEFELEQILKRRTATDLDAGTGRARTHGHNHHAQCVGCRAPFIAFGVSRL